LTQGFDPTIPSQTCKPSPQQIKIYDGLNKEKKVFQDFSVRYLGEI